MGLTIHWEAKDKKAYIDPQVALNCIEFIKEFATREQWPVLSQWDKVVDPSQYSAGFMGQPKSTNRTHSRVVGISVHPHKDSESVEFEFVLDTGKLMYYRDYGHLKNRSNSTFCKTHYSNFITHKKVCRLLEAIDKHFVPLSVSDEGDYYGIWDDEKGKKRFGEYVAFVHDFGQKLPGLMGIKDSANVEIISGEQQTDGWKEEYVDHLASKLSKKGGQNDKRKK